MADKETAWLQEEIKELTEVRAVPTVVMLASALFRVPLAQWVLGVALLQVSCPILPHSASDWACCWAA